jgi:hypothetical protein
MKQTFKCLFAAFAAMVISVSAFAQVTTSAIAGKITDAEGAVAGAAVVVTHVPTGTNYYSVADENGAFRVNSVTPGGPYTVSVEMLGYRKVQYNGLYAPLGEVLKLNPELEVETREAALEGALHIIAENISDNAEIRKVLRALLWSDGEIVTKASDPEAGIFPPATYLPHRFFQYSYSTASCRCGQSAVQNRNKQCP